MAPGTADATVDGSGRVADREWPPRLADASAAAGGAVWLAIVALGTLPPIREVIALAVLVLVPLALRLADTPRRDGRRSPWYVLAAASQPVAAVPAVISLTMDPGAAAAALAVPWALATVAIAGFGAWRLLERGPWPVEELAVDAGLLYVVVGGAFLLFDRAGVSLVFEPILVSLTVVHFHYAGSALPVLAGMAGRLAPGGRLGSLLRATTGVIVLGPGIVGTGITLVALELPLAAAIELLAVAAFTTAVAAFSLAVLRGVLPQLPSRPQQLLVGVASCSVALSMGFAVVYGLARATGGTHLGIDATSFGLMVRYHGQLNAYGFALPALVGWRLAVPASRARAPGVPLCGIAAGLRVGTDFLERRGLAAGGTAAGDGSDGEDPAATVDGPVGMMDDLDEYEHEGFDPAAVAPSVRRFYERSAEYVLGVEPDWAPPWRWLAPLYRAVATRVGQLSVPTAPVDGDARLSGRVVRVDPADEHTGDRAWIRSNAGALAARGADGGAGDSGDAGDDSDAGDDGSAGGEGGTGDPGSSADGRETTYLGIYDRHEAGGTSFVRVAFPLPGGNLTGILRVENGGEDGDALVLSSLRAPGNADDAGLYLVLGGVPVRLPLDERFVVEPAGSDAVVATHRVELLGLRVFTLTYEIERADVDREAEATTPDLER